MRVSLGTSKLFIPLTIFFAVVGQVWGSRWRRKKMSVRQIEARQQVPDIELTKFKVKEEDAVVLLLNMGGPSCIKKVGEFQKWIFEDPLLIRFPLSFVLQKFFAWALIKFRIRDVEKRYNMIGGRSPIYHSTQAQTRALTEELKRRGRNIKVTYSFNYSPPYPHNTMNVVKKLKKKAVIPLSLYPHYSKATTGSNIHYLKKEADANYPPVRFINPDAYYLHDGYIQSFVDRINEQLSYGESLDDYYVLFSAHGLPLYFLIEGDPYPFQISQTVAGILAKLNRQQDWVISYQSAVGTLQWLKPSTDDILKALAKRGVKKLLVVPVSFVGDHIETILEIDVEYREMAEKLGITDFRMAKAIECHPGFINALADSVESVLLPSKAQINIKQKYGLTAKV